MQEPPKRKRPDLSSLIGWAIFFLVIAGGPLLNAIQRTLGPGVNLAAYLPYVVAGLVLLSVVVSAMQAIGRGRRSREMTLGSDAQPSPINRPLSPFGGDTPAPRIPDMTLTPPPRTPPAMRYPPTQGMPSSSGEGAQLPGAPKFEPLLPPFAVAVGAVGLLLLGGAALLVLGAGAP
jgi:hypothetical protein